jgi:hypothetical protein
MVPTVADWSVTSTHDAAATPAAIWAAAYAIASAWAVWNPERAETW